jgi:hypothetical protein
VVIFDSAPYHHIKIYRLRMISWLEAGDQLWWCDMRKHQL